MVMLAKPTLGLGSPSLVKLPRFLPEAARYESPLLRVSELVLEREPAAPSPFSVDPRETVIFGKFSLSPSESHESQDL
jgi:hypothetical protein